MKTKSLLIIAFLLVTVTAGYAQRIAALHSSNGVSMFQDVNPLADAYNAAQNGDTIYLSGGSFAPPPLFNKGLRIIGAGYHPDTTQATLPTHISSHVTYGDSASYLYFEGLRIQGNVQKSQSSAAEFITFKRVYFDGTFYLIHGTDSTKSSQMSVMECIIAGNNLQLNYLVNSLFTNCIITNKVNNSTSNNFSNNIFLSYNTSCYSTSSHLIRYCDYNTFNNNVIVTSCLASTGVIGNTFMNNVFVSSSPGYGSSPIVSGNYTDVPQGDIYVNQTGNTFDFSHDYHLKFPQTYTGTDGTQAGIYGGYFPFKAKGVPSNPHISTKTISPATDQNGNLQININVHAQDE